MVQVDPDFAPATEVILEEGTPRAVSSTFRSTVMVKSRRSDRVALDVTVNEPGEIVVLEGFLPGWRATIDGIPVPVRRANALFLEVPVQPGEHRVLFIYRPGAAVVGVCLTLVTSLLLLISLVSRKKAPGEVATPRPKTRLGSGSLQPRISVEALRHPLLR